MNIKFIFLTICILSSISVSASADSSEVWKADGVAIFDLTIEYENSTYDQKRNTNSIIKEGTLKVFRGEVTDNTITFTYNLEGVDKFYNFNVNESSLKINRFTGNLVGSNEFSGLILGINGNNIKPGSIISSTAVYFYDLNNTKNSVNYVIDEKLEPFAIVDGQRNSIPSWSSSYYIWQEQESNNITYIYDHQSTIFTSERGGLIIQLQTFVTKSNSTHWFDEDYTIRLRESSNIAIISNFRQVFAVSPFLPLPILLILFGINRRKLRF
jgi:hypothetical protein